MEAYNEQRLLRTLSLHESSAALLSTCRMRERKVKVNQEKDGGLDQRQLLLAKFLLSLVSRSQSLESNCLKSMNQSSKQKAEFFYTRLKRKPLAQGR